MIVNPQEGLTPDLMVALQERLRRVLTEKLRAVMEEILAATVDEAIAALRVDVERSLADMTDFFQVEIKRKELE